MEIVCPASHPGAANLVSAIPLLANQGVTTIEIDLNNERYLTHREVDEMQAIAMALADSGIRVHSIHAPCNDKCDISSLDDAVQECGVDTLIESVELASLLEAGKVVLHASSLLNGHSSGRLERARGALRELSLVARDTGVMLALENLPPGYLGHTPDDVARLLEGCERGGIGICFDAGHANLSGRFAEFTRTLLPHSISAHVHDNDGAQDQHQFPGQGTIDWAVFGDYYRKSGCNASIMLECAPPEGTPWKEAFQRLRMALGD